MADDRCKVTYNGTTYPQFHGVRCDKKSGHDSGPPHGNAKHLGHDKNFRPLMWYTDEQKAARRAEEKIK